MTKYTLSDLDIPGIPQAPIQNLAKLSSYLETYGQELDYKSNFVNVYGEVRSNYLVKSLTLLAQGSVSTAERRNTPVYEKGTCGFDSYTEAMLRMFKVCKIILLLLLLDANMCIFNNLIIRLYNQVVII